MNYSITQNGEPLDPSNYKIDEDTRIFSTEEEDLVLDFSRLDEWTFKTGDNCTFKTGYYCTFKTGDNCTFKTGYYCTFKTGYYCTFDTGSHCTFDTWYNCTFKTGAGCTFDTGDNCTFKTGKECILVRRDVYEIIEIPEDTTIQLKEHGVKGYTKVSKTKIIAIDGKDIEISEDSFNELKKQLT